MMQAVLVLTDRTPFSEAWQNAANALGFEVVSAHPSELVAKMRGGFVVFDGGAPMYDEDELLACASFVRSERGEPVVVTDAARPFSDVGLLHELARGLVGSMDDVERLAHVIARRLDGKRHERFEYVTVSPANGAFLAVLGDGSSVAIARPAHASDDGSDVVDILIGEDPRGVTIGLSSGASFELRVENAPKPAVDESISNGSAAIPLDGVRLGARLRELRTAAGLTQAELARRTGIHRPNIARVEAGRHTPSLETLARLAEAIGVSTTRIFSDQ